MYLNIYMLPWPLEHYIVSILWLAGLLLVGLSEIAGCKIERCLKL